MIPALPEPVVIINGWECGELKSYATKMGATFYRGQPMFTSEQLEKYARGYMAAMLEQVAWATYHDEPLNQGARMKTEDVIDMAREAGMSFHLGQPHALVVAQLMRFAELVAAKEREACAALCSPSALIDGATYAETAAIRKCAKAIRARSLKGGE